MPSVVIFHAADDALPARALAEKLRGAKLTPVLEKYGDEARNAAKSAKVSIALWSPRSVGQATLIDDVEAVRAGKGKVLHARMQNTAPPAKFNTDPSFDLTGWRGEDDFRPWRELAEEIAAKAGVGPLPEPAARAPSGFFQPGRPGEGAPAAAPAPQQRRPQQQQAAQQRAPAPRPQQAQRAAAPPPRAQQQQQRAAEPAPSSGGGRMIMIVLAVLLLGAAGAGGWWFMNNSQGAQASATAWEEVAKNDASAIRAFLAASPGDFRDDAEEALATLEQQTYDAAQEADTIDAFESFLREFPESDNSIAARGRIAELRAMPAPAEDVLPTETPTEATDPDLLPPGAATPDPNAPTPLAPADPAAPPATPPTEPAPTPG